MPEEEEAQRKNGSYGERLCGSEVDVAGSGLFPMTLFDFNGFENSGSAKTVLGSLNVRVIVRYIFIT
jgi:hypothetical protein